MDDRNQLEREAIFNSGGWVSRAMFCTELSKQIEFALACAQGIADNGQEEYLNGLRDLVYVISQINNKLWGFDDLVDSECASNADKSVKLLRQLTDAIRKEDDEYRHVIDEERLKEMMKNLSE